MIDSKRQEEKYQEESLKKTDQISNEQLQNTEGLKPIVY